MLQVLPGSVAHAPACIGINEAVVFRSGADPSAGFVVERLTEDRFAYLLRHGVVRVACSNGEVVGYLIAYARGSEPFSDLLPYLKVAEWSDPTFPDTEKLFYVHQKATAPN